MSIRLTTSDKGRLLRARANLLRWFSHSGRSFFWRRVERNPYRVLVTEFMLQQTQTFRVEEYLPKFLRQFPTVGSLAKAPSSAVIKTWQGLGYNRRALNLQKTAQRIVEKHRGVFPHDDTQLLDLPGIGEYTMRALQVFAFGKRVSVVDVNVARVLSRMTKKMRSPGDTLPTKDVHAINELILPRSADKWHEALMDLGATICKSKPVCSNCPVRKECASYPLLINSRPNGKTKRPVEKIYFGKPKRLWRGIVLKLFTKQRSLSLDQIERSVSSPGLMPKEFSLFIGQVVKELENEGFIRRSKNSAWTLTAETQRTQS